jgi:hypothetical protein
MTYLFALIFVCMALGLFTPRGNRRLRWLVPALAAALVLLFLISPDLM